MPKRLGLALICALSLACTGPAPAEQQLELVGTFTWSDKNDPHFGGFSGLELVDDGRGFVALSDRAGVVRGTLEREAGKIVGVNAEKVRPLIAADGKQLRQLKSDSEGLAMTPDGDAYVSFEGQNRVGHLFIDTGVVEDLVRAPEFSDLQLNSGLEALALDPEGRLITIPERSGELDRPFPVYRLEDGKWSIPYSIRRQAPYLLVGADTGPDNRLYVLERDFTGVFGFSSRVRSFAYGRDGLTDERILLESRTGEFDNLEGISVWRGGDGAIWITMISDDNQNFIQRTEFVEYRLVDDPTG